MPDLDVDLDLWPVEDRSRMQGMVIEHLHVLVDEANAGAKDAKKQIRRVKADMRDAVEAAVVAALAQEALSALERPARAMSERIAPTLSGTASGRGERGGAPASRNANWSKRPASRGAFPKSSVMGRSAPSSLSLSLAPADERTRSSLAWNSSSARSG